MWTGCRKAACAAVALCLTSVTAGAQDLQTYHMFDLPDWMWERMVGVSWHEGIGCPERDELVLVSVPYRDFLALPRIGWLVVARAHADEVGAIFQQIYDEGAMRFARIEPVSLYGGSDDASMAANNTSAFNCRTVTGGTRLSEHSSGAAIDVNPAQNPYVKGDLTLPPGATSFDEEAERESALAGREPGIVTDAVVTIFRNHGWSWGGDWTSLKDYQHFSKSGN